MSSASESDDSDYNQNVDFVKGSQMEMDISDSDSEELRIPRNREEEEEEEEVEEVPKSFGLGSRKEPIQSQPTSYPTQQRVKQTTLPAQLQSSKRFVPQQPIPIDKDFASFEKHTKGIGSKLLMKMGYKPGQGLGVDGRGITAPIDVQLRPAKMGLGMGTKQNTKRVDKDTREEPTFIPNYEPQQRWKKSKRKGIVYKTAQEILKQMNQTGLVDSAPVATTIRDMTGKEERIITDFSQLSSQIGADERLPELRFNIKMIVGLCQNDVINTGKKILAEKAYQKQRAEEKKQLETLISSSKQKLDRLTKVLKIAQECKEVNGKHAKELSQSRDFSSIRKLFGGQLEILRSSYKQEMQEYSIDTMVLSFLSPHIRTILRDWNPLKQPRFGIDDLEYLAVVFATDGRDVMTPFEHMIYLVWLPRVRQVINNDWNPLEPEEAIEFLETWKDTRVISKWMYFNIANQLVIPKLTTTLEDWNMKKSVLVHTWLFPWLPLFGDLLNPLWTACRRKFQMYLNTWVVGDPTALSILKTWAPIFTEHEMAALINQSILPQLSNHLRTVFVLNPQNQNILPMMQLLEWKDHIPLHLFSHLFETDFFPKFHQCLWTWLSSSHANLVEITQWYTSWKNLFESQGLERLDAFKQGFRTALDMMNQGTSAAMPSRFVPSKPKQQQTFTEESAFGDMSFKDYVELLCSESNLEFVPTTKRHSSGKDLYRLGKLQVYIEDGVLFVQDGKNGYTYSSIEDAIQKALSLQ